MAVRNSQRKKPKASAVDLAVAALDEHPRPNPMDADMRDVDSDPTSLDLPLPGSPLPGDLDDIIKDIHMIKVDFAFDLDEETEDVPQDSVILPG